MIRFCIKGSGTRAVRIFIFQPAAHRLIGADAKEYRIVIFSAGRRAVRHALLRR